MGRNNRISYLNLAFNLNPRHKNYLAVMVTLNVTFRIGGVRGKGNVLVLFLGRREKGRGG